MQAWRKVRGAILAAVTVVGCLLFALKGFPPDLIPTRVDPLAPGVRPRDLNLLVITLDTTRADAIGTYGGRAITPTLDQLASSGVAFLQASTVAPLTLPAHCSLFTALFPPGHQVRGNGQIALASRFVTLAERLNASGFQTGAFVSSFVLDHAWGLNQGFDVYRDLDGRPGPIDRDSLRSPADRIVDAALGWLHEVDSRPFFAWLHFYDAHSPARPPAEFASPNGQSAYVGAIGFIDFQLSRVINFLDEGGLLDNTVVVVVGDHGESLGEHGEASHGLFIYESVMRVPMIIRAPFANMQGRRVSDTVRIVDVMPTVLDLLGQTSAAATDGKTLVPLMSGAVKRAGTGGIFRVAIRFRPLRVESARGAAPRPVQADSGSAAGIVRPRIRPARDNQSLSSAFGTGDGAHATTAGDRTARWDAASGRPARHGLRHARTSRGARIRQRVRLSFAG